MTVAYGFPCPNCGAESTETTRTTAYRNNRAGTLQRSRRCGRCGHGFQTVERLYGRPARKLTMTVARGIRKLAAQGISQAEIARNLAVSRKTVWNVVHQEQWTEPVSDERRDR